MNLAHLHLVLNHIPIIGIPVALLFFLYGIVANNRPSRRFALFVLITLSAMILPVYWTGEPAEKIVEHLPGVAESYIEAHEEAAEFSMVLTLCSGVVAFFALWFQSDTKKGTLINFFVLGIASIAVMNLIYTANLGGKIRHSELRTGVALQQLDTGSWSEKGKDQDD